jgi:hypothetical protein
MEISTKDISEWSISGPEVKYMKDEPADLQEDIHL